MGKFDRYVLSQLLAVFALASVVLVLIYWINRAVRLFDWLIASGQTATVFLEFTALTLPNVIRIVLPLAAFAATLYTVNRLANESELVVVQATGFGPFRLARPVLAFGVIVGLLVAGMVHVAVPESIARLAERRVQIARNVTSQILVEGRFVHPSQGVTLYIREITGSGQLRDIYIDDRRDAAVPVTYTALRALLVRTDNGPRLVMFDGMAQRLDAADRALSITRFSELSLDVAALVPGGGAAPGGPSLRAAGTGALLRADPATAAAMGLPPHALRAEGHQRIAQSLLAIAVPLTGFAVLIFGGFSRFGIWNYLFAAIGLIVALWFADSALSDAAARAPGLWPLVYVPALGGLAVAAAILAASGAPRRRGRAA